MDIVAETNIPELSLAFRDDTRDVYALPRQQLLIVYTDRMAVNGTPLSSPIPTRGIVLNQITLYWINRFTHLVSHNLVARQVENFPQELQAHASVLKGRSVIAQTLRTLPLKFRTIGNVAGEDWKAYQATRMVGGKTLPKGLKECARLEQPVFTVLPGPDAPRDIDDLPKWAQRMYGQMLYSNLEEICLSIFGVARLYAGARGIAIADATFEFGLHEGKPYLINQVMTPDVSVCWPVESFTPGAPQPSLDKQPVLDWLARQGWSAGQPMPPIPQEVVIDTAKRYRLIFDVMTGRIAREKNE